MVGKVDEDVGRNLAQFGKGLRNVILAVDADPAHDFVAQSGIDQLTHGTVGTAQNRSHT